MCSMFTPNTPHFFKIIMEETIQDGKLRIPKRFWRSYGTGMPSQIELRVPSGVVWKVGLTKSEGNVWLQHGWREFAEHYSLKLGHFLVFRYDGNHNFHVLISDTSLSEIDYPHVSNSNNHGENRNLDVQLQEVKVEEVEDDDDVSVEILAKTPPSKKVRQRSEASSSRPSKKRKTSLSNAAIRGPGSEEDDLPSGHQRGQRVLDGMQKTNAFREECKAEVLERAKAFKSKNPFYIVVMHPSYVNPGRKIALRASFREKHFKNLDGDVILCKDGKTWSAKYHSKSICSGWKAFVDDNSLEVGDVCVFELFKSKNATLKVTIYRVNETPNCHTSFKMVLGSNVENRHDMAFSVKKVETLIDDGEKAKSCKLQVGDKTWPVMLLINGNQARFSAGWAAFRRDNFLKAGDTCAFAFIEKSSGTMKASFIRTKDVVK